MSPATGRRILADRFEIIDPDHPAGRGGMGVVYRAVDLSDDQLVALKVLTPAHLGAPGMRMRFAAEVEALKTLRAQGLPRFVADGLSDEAMPFIAMEWMPGSSLADLARLGTMRTLAGIAGVADAVLDLLDEMHRQGWAHGDVKAANVLVAPRADGSGVRVSLIDLGLAHRIRPDDENAVVDEVCGTPEYMAPELALGAPASVASDLYALGIVLYELITGAPPFEGVTPTSVVMKQIEEQVVPPSARCGGCPYVPGLDEVVQRALEKLPSDRYASAHQMREALDAVVALLDRSDTVSMGPPPSLEIGQPTRPLEVEEPAAGHVDEAALPTVAACGGLLALRARIGEALREGRLADALDGYLHLAHALERRRHYEAARTELREAIDVITVGQGPESPSAPAALWRALFELAALEDLAHNRPQALAAARASLACARRIGSTHATRRALMLCRRLGLEPPPAVARLA